MGKGIMAVSEVSNGWYPYPLRIPWFSGW